MLTDEELDAIAARVAACPRGPWFAREEDDYYAGGTYVGARPYYTTYDHATRTTTVHEGLKDGVASRLYADVFKVEDEGAEAFLTHAIVDVPKMLREIRFFKKLLHEECPWCHGDEPHEWRDDCPRMLRCRGAEC